MVAYALSMKKSIEISEPFMYKEAMSCSEVIKWIVAMTEESNLFTRTRHES